MALRGYEASAVDAHIDNLESKLTVLVEESRLIGERVARLEAELISTAARLDAAAELGSAAPSEREVERLEALAQSIIAVLHSAHQEAASVRERAEAEAQAILHEAEARLADADRRSSVVTVGDGGEPVPGPPADEPAP